MAAGENKIEIPKWARALITAEDAEKISAAVGKAEEKSSGEIVPMIVRRSSHLGMLPLTLTLLGLLILLVFEIPEQGLLADPKWTWLLFVVAAVFYALSLFLSRWSRLQRLFIPQKDQVFQVETRALLEFYQCGVRQTRGHTGILLFLSVMERKAVVLADETIAQKVPKETWTQVCADMVAGIQEGKTTQGLVQAIEHCGGILATHFPASKSNENEISNELLIKE